MTISTYRTDRRFSACPRAFLVTGVQEHYRFNLDNIENNRSGYWVIRQDRAHVGDLLFFLMPHPTSRGGYPRSLYAGIIRSLDFEEEPGRVVFHVREFVQLDDIHSDVKLFLEGNVPPMGNLVLSIWDEHTGPPEPYGIDPVDSEDDAESYPEGARSYRRHRHIERNPTLVRKAKARRLKRTKRLECEVCAVDFRAMYGERGEGFIEAHHTIPVSELGDGMGTRIEDLALVCSNCHRMLHRGDRLITVEELRHVVEQQRAA